MSEKHRGPGRPKLSDAERKIVFPIRLSPNELDLFARAARKRNMELREWINWALVEAAESR
jgi:hypothetical protein